MLLPLPLLWGSSVETTEVARGPPRWGVWGWGLGLMEVVVVVLLLLGNVTVRHAGGVCW